MKRILSIFFVLTFSLIAFAQKTISGVITDADGKPLASASVTVEEPGKNAILAYGISNSKGEYKVNVTSAESNLDLKIKAFNQKPITQSIKNEDQKLNFTMDAQATEIQEVRLKTKLITKKGDTISYDLKSFENKNDRTLADVLKKIPGIEVNKDGTVLYQGEAINKFYVNGKDLMEGGYGTINNSLPKDAVSKVEVLENHQPVSILRDKVPSEQAALNIKLKKSVTMTGRGEIGAGFSPLLWNVKLTPMFFGQKNQWVVNYKANNNGESVENEGNLLSFGSRWEGRRSQVSANRWLNVEQAQTPDLPEKRYLLNNVHFFSANLLTSPFKNKEWELKLNANYTNNAIERDSYSNEILVNGSNIERTIHNDFYTNKAKGEMIFTKNAKKGFFKNTTTWTGMWSDNQADAFNQISADENLNAPTFNFTNSLSTILPWKDKLFNVMSYVSIQNDRQTLSSRPGRYSNFVPDPLLSTPEQFIPNNFEALRQYISLKSINTTHSASVGLSYRKWTFTPEAGISVNFNSMKSNLNGINGNESTLYGLDYQNNINWNEVQPYTQVGVNYKSQNINLNLTLPVNFYGIDYNDNLRGTGQAINKTRFEPTMFGSYDFASFFKLWIFGSIANSFGNFGDLYAGNILTNPTFVQVKSSQLPETTSRNASSRLEYRNPLNNLFFNVSYRIGNNTNNLINNQKVSPNGTIRSEILERDNTSTSNSQRAEIGKYFPSFKTNFSVNFTNSNSKNYSMISDVNEDFETINERFYSIKNEGQAFGLKFNNTYFSWLSVDYNLTMNWRKSTDNSSNLTNKNSDWNHNLATYIYPSDNHTFGFIWDDITTTLAMESYRNSFFDVSYQYTWVKKKIDFEFKWLNIGNKKVYETVSVNTLTNSIRRNTYNIRPSQFMFTVKFNFK
ncbi:carboxypeptidase regulatory-like domain-containing protein [Epilithonimonas arachidiradicis]|uniref:Carboxypeptidase family protein n=1 Tax=Epilithonimonas arachidiradicis TaxID=1617282 RepID=A0A420DD80_9FLAO|nr:carboxypeptidase regulatory-like domain-containing protein [Epilithonimonas arachidiradicis]RKE89860.1 carboxypeptidase family protein [Epilithonimonas arachidiradicis]GGG45876.1 TonB-dependent receptor [Epilithonimonas arachidiradicis]